MGTDLGRGWLSRRIESPLRKRCWVRKYLFEYTPYRVFPAAVDLENPRRLAASLLRLRPSSGMRSFSPRPHGRILSQTAGRQSPNAMPWRFFPVVCRHLQRPPLTQIRPYPPRRQKTHEMQVPPVDMRVFEECPATKINTGLAEREILTLVSI
jgi:hypothetical protein